MPSADHERFLAALPGAVLAEVSSLEAGAPATLENAAAPLACPSCREVMTRVHARGPDVEIDRCPKHGTFYDRGELAALAASLSRGGWSRAGVASASTGAAVAGAAVAGAAVAGVGVVGAAALASPSPQAASTSSDVVQTVAEVAGGAVDTLDLVGGFFELVGELFQ